MAQDENLVELAGRLAEAGHPEMAAQVLAYGTPKPEPAPEPEPAEEPEPDVRHVTVRGVDLDVDARALSSWDVTRCIARMQSDSTDEADKMVAAVELADLLFDKGAMGRIVGSLGGRGVAQTSDVVSFIGDVFAELAPKA